MSEAPERIELKELHVTPTTLAEADERLRDAEIRIVALEQERDEAVSLKPRFTKVCEERTFWERKSDEYMCKCTALEQERQEWVETAMALGEKEVRIRQLSADLARLREAVQIADELLSEYYDCHHDPNNYEYNECDTAPCAWCSDVDRFRALAAEQGEPNVD